MFLFSLPQKRLWYNIYNNTSDMFSVAVWCHAGRPVVIHCPLALQQCSSCALCTQRVYVSTKQLSFIQVLLMMNLCGAMQFGLLFSLCIKASELLPFSVYINTQHSSFFFCFLFFVYSVYKDAKSTTKSSFAMFSDHVLC